MEHPKNRFLAALDRAPVHGCWLGTGSAYVAEIVATTGFEWLLIDGEHAPNTVPGILAQLQAIAPYDTAPVVRAVNHDPALIKQLLDIGAQTLMIPMVETAAQAEALVAATRYPPAGFRGVGGGLIRAGRWGAVADYQAEARDEICLIVQIESQTGVENAEAIAAVDGVDGVFVGPADLSTSVGHPGAPGHETVQRLIHQALEAARRAGKPAGILAPAASDADAYGQAGFQFIATGIDIVMLADTARATARRHRGGERAGAGGSASRTY
ncbi:HpcH/HpaI aldolase/citrate lyase family protein [Salinisphaera sp. Q1T1-3]|uniref:HpcH/HpaI aldolase family protein n=1 Tax=Salinisphaera sp. Q1T1-3 TaxID=2321229 RepID=UPI000E75626B|nr:HpcH/HpaI aldolase/citrate lyase family protein [Salinisphaera sp. Q1T1-3]RJS93768.1 2-dehydro-3-deoxyglucarate aldolase [Salinisphaera sp. Q1T1-3]